jgi:hypothetical protein
MRVVSFEEDKAAAEKGKNKKNWARVSEHEQMHCATATMFPVVSPTD